MKAARDKHKEARQALAAGVDPMAKRKAEKITARTDMLADFEAAAREMWSKKLAAGRSSGYVNSILATLEKDVFPWVGGRSPRDLEHDEPTLLAILHRVEKLAPETARRLRGIMGDVFRYAMTTSRARRDPTQTLKGAVITPKAGHFAAITTPDKFRELLRGLHSYSGELVTQCLLQLSASSSVRQGSPWMYSSRPVTCSITSWRWRRLAAFRIPASNAIRTRCRRQIS
ncbi:site-specific recombinase, phage integrase family [Bordetella hinzii 1277]|nr:site-specific recombinase, phage integrase family [Bordetella hinzii 1277]